MTPLGFSATEHVLHDHFIGFQLLRKPDRIPFALFQIGLDASSFILAGSYPYELPAADRKKASRPHAPHTRMGSRFW
jgi:hypothetical protein